MELMVTSPAWENSTLDLVFTYRPKTLDRCTTEEVPISDHRLDRPRMKIHPTTQEEDDPDQVPEMGTFNFRNADGQKMKDTTHWNRSRRHPVERGSIQWEPRAAEKVEVPRYCKYKGGRGNYQTPQFAPPSPLFLKGGGGTGNYQSDFWSRGQVKKKLPRVGDFWGRGTVVRRGD